MVFLPGCFPLFVVVETDNQTVNLIVEVVPPRIHILVVGVEDGRKAILYPPLRGVGEPQGYQIGKLIPLGSQRAAVWKALEWHHRQVSARAWIGLALGSTGGCVARIGLTGKVGIEVRPKADDLTTDVAVEVPCLGRETLH